MFGEHTITRRTGALVGSLTLTLLAALLLGRLAHYGLTLNALSKAGFKAPSGAALNVVKPLFDMIKDNALYVAVVATPAIITFVGLLFMLGSARAVDIAMRVAGGIMIVVSASAVLA